MKTINGSRQLRSARTDAAHRTQIVAAFERSGLSATTFARQQGLNYTTFCNWRQREAKSVPAFVQVEVTAPTAPMELVIELGTQARMRIHSESQIPLATHLLHRLNLTGAC